MRRGTRGTRAGEGFRAETLPVVDDNNINRDIMHSQLTSAG